MGDTKSIVKTLRSYSDGIQGITDLTVGLLMCNSIMIDAANRLEKQASDLRLLRKSIRLIIDENKRSRLQRKSP